MLMPSMPARAVRTLLVALVLVFAVPFSESQAASVPLRLIAFNDFHGHLQPDGNTFSVPDPDEPGRMVKVPASGAAWLAGLIGQLRSEAPNSVVFSSGDMIGAAPLVSMLFRHESTVAVMNAIGLDFAITGNHEFDAGLGELQRIVHGGCRENVADQPITSCAIGRYDGAKFPLLAANVVGPNGEPILQPTLIKDIAGVKVGFIGVVTRTTPTIVTPSGIEGLKFLDEAETFNRYAGELKKLGVKTIVAVVHEGGKVATNWNDTGCAGKEGEIFAIADKLSPDIGLLFSAHTHQGYNCIIDTPLQKGLRVIQANSYGFGVSVIDVELNTETGEIDRSRTHSRNIPVVNETRGKFAAVPSDPAVAKLVADYAALTAAKADRPIGSINGSIGVTDTADFPSGRMVADAQLEATRGKEAGSAEVAFTNPGGIRASLPCPATPPCTVTYGQAFSMQPFGNSLVVMTLTGAQLKAALEEQRQSSDGRMRFLQPSRGLTYTWKSKAPEGERVADLMLDGVPVQPEKRYRVTVNSFLADGGDGFTKLIAGTERLGGPLEADALEQFLSTHRPFSADPEPRIKLAD